MSIKSLLNQWLENKSVRISIPGNLAPDSSENEHFNGGLDQSETKALFHSVLHEKQNDGIDGRR